MLIKSEMYKKLAEAGRNGKKRPWGINDFFIAGGVEAEGGETEEEPSVMEIDVLTGEMSVSLFRSHFRWVRKYKNRAEMDYYRSFRSGFHKSCLFRQCEIETSIF